MEQDNKTSAKNTTPIEKVPVSIDQQNVASSPSKMVQTYAEDVAQVISTDKSGLIKKIIHEAEEEEVEKINLSPESKQKKLLMTVSMILLVFSLGILYYFYLQTKIESVSVAIPFTPLIFNDKNVFVEVKDLKKEEIAQTVANEVEKTEVKSGGVEAIYLTEEKQVLGLRRFLALTKLDFAPDVQSIDSTTPVSENFLMGVVHSQTNNFFILLKMNSIGDIFNQLRAWEKKMFYDLHEFFGINLTAENKNLLTTDFKDGIVENKNARILYDAQGNMVMAYVFINNNSVIITNSTSAAHELVLRLSAGQIKK